MFLKKEEKSVGLGSANMIMFMSTKIIGISLLVLMLITYISFFSGLSFLHSDFLALLRYLNLPESVWHFLDTYFYNGAL